MSERRHDRERRRRSPLNGAAFIKQLKEKYTARRRRRILWCVFCLLVLFCFALESLTKKKDDEVKW